VDTVPVITVPIVQSPDDTVENLRRNRYKTGTKRGKIGKNFRLEFRFRDIPLPVGARIVSARLQHYCIAYCRKDVVVEYRGALADGDARGDTTLSSVVEHPEEWDKHQHNDSADLTTVVQELIDQPEWRAGSSLWLYADDAGSSAARVVGQYDENPRRAAILEIQYEPPGSE
jgi:hypothetical protein